QIVITPWLPGLSQWLTPPRASQRLSGLQALEAIFTTFKTNVSCPVAASQAAIVILPECAASRRPFGLQAIVGRISAAIGNLSSLWPVVVSTIPERSAKRRPSGLQANAVSFRERSSCPVVASQNFVWLPQVVARCLSSGPHATTIAAALAGCSGSRQLMVSN